MTTTVISNVRVFDGDGLTAPSTVVVADGVVASVGEGAAPGADLPPGATTVDGTGRTLLPGLIDAHMHVATRDNLDGLARNGVTTGFDMASWPPALTAAMRAEEGTASIISAGVPFIGPAGPHSHFVTAEGAIVTDPADVPAGVAQRLADGSDYIKIVLEAPGNGGPEPAVAEAVVAAAHAAGRKVVAHAAHVDAFRLALDIGADVITHVPTQDAVTAEMAQRMVANGQVAIPTLTVSEVTVQAMPRPGADFAHARSSVVALLEAGVPVFAGTDSVDSPGTPFTIPLGPTLHRELGLLVDAGMTPVQALRAATSEPALYFGLDDRGAVREGLRGDLLLVDGDPTADIAATLRIDGVWIGGERVR
jgi:imidazolonepropionase-like amidohydrolase